jgi:hypothetical protein
MWAVNIGNLYPAKLTGKIQILTFPIMYMAGTKENRFYLLLKNRVAIFMPKF